MIVNGQSMLSAAPITEMINEKRRKHGVSYGLSEAGYDIRVAQDILFFPPKWMFSSRIMVDGLMHKGRFTLASAMEEFDMPTNMVGIVHDKSTWAREGLSLFNTVIEPGFRGGLTLELVFNGQKEVHIPAGAGIAQVVFHRTEHLAQYNGKYQHQSTRPVAAIYEKG